MNGLAAFAAILGVVAVAIVAALGVTWLAARAGAYDDDFW